MIVSALCLFLMVPWVDFVCFVALHPRQQPWVDLHHVIVVFSDQIHFFIQFLRALSIRMLA